MPRYCKCGGRLVLRKSNTLVAVYYCRDCHTTTRQGLRVSEEIDAILPAVERRAYVEGGMVGLTKHYKDTHGLSLRSAYALAKGVIASVESASR